MKNATPNFFRRRRDELGKTQFEMALAIGVVPATVSIWETGICLPSMTLFESLASAYQVSLPDIVTEVAALGMSRPKRKKDRLVEAMD